MRKYFNFISLLCKFNQLKRVIYCFRFDPMKRSYTEGTIRRSPEKVGFKTSSTVTSPFSDTESLSPPGQFRTANSRSPEFHET